MEGLINRTLVQAVAALVYEQRRVQRAGCHWQAAFAVVLKRLASRSAQRYPAGLVKLALGNVKPRFAA